MMLSRFYWMLFTKYDEQLYNSNIPLPFIFAFKIYMNIKLKLQMTKCREAA